MNTTSIPKFGSVNVAQSARPAEMSDSRPVLGSGQDRVRFRATGQKRNMNPVARLLLAATMALGAIGGSASVPSLTQSASADHCITCHPAPGETRQQMVERHRQEDAALRQKHQQQDQQLQQQQQQQREQFQQQQEQRRQQFQHQQQALRDAFNQTTHTAAERQQFQQQQQARREQFQQEQQQQQQQFQQQQQQARQQLNQQQKAEKDAQEARQRQELAALNNR
jgi:hypothetical protein